MKRTHKKLLIAALVLVAIIGGIYSFNQKRLSDQQRRGSIGANDVLTTFDVMPPFATGQILAVEGNSLRIRGAFEAGETTDITAAVTKDTEIYTQILANDIPTLAVQKLEDIKPGNEGVFYFSDEEGKSAVLTKIQILPKGE